MADYSDAYNTQCRHCGAWSGHTPECGSPEMNQKRLVAKRKTQGFEPAEIPPHYNSGREIDKWKCLRGCGCIVHDPVTHMINVCTKEYSGV